VTTAFVLSGGGSLGSVQVGMLQALEDRGVAPDLLIGTSAGALNAAYLAGHGMSHRSLAYLAQIWCGLRRQTVFPFDPLRHLLALAGSKPSLCPNRGLRQLIQRHLPYHRLEEAAIPVYIVTTNLLSGEEVLLSRGDALSAVLASAAIPGVLPPVVREGLTLVDGGVADNTALSQAISLGADVIYALPAGFACALERAPRGALGAAVQALTLLIEQRLIMEVAHLASHVDIRVLPPLCPLAVSSIDFTHGAELIERAHQATADWLDRGGPSLPHPQRFLSLHHHGVRGQARAAQGDPGS